MVADDNNATVGGNSKDTTMNLVRILAKYKRGLTLAHINAQSLNNKLDEFRFVFENSGVDIVCVSETWFSSATPDSFISLSGYKIFREDRNGNAGGVAIFVKDNLSCRVCLKSSTNLVSYECNVEFIFIEIISDGKKILVGCAYRPNKRIPFTNFFAALETLAVEYNEVIITGDFNSNLLLESVLIENMLSFGLTPTNTVNPTHHTTTNRTLLDIFFVSNISNILLYDQVSASCFSKHDLIFLTYNFRIPLSQHKIYFRDFKNINYSLLQENISYIDWEQVYYMPSVDEQVLFLENSIQHLYENTVPVKSINTSASTKPWFSSHIKFLIHKRDLAYLRWKRFRTPELKEVFKAARKKVNMSIRIAKTEYYSRRFGSAAGSKQTWKYIREIGIGSTQNVLNDQVDVEELNSIFMNIPFVAADESFYNFPNLEPNDFEIGHNVFKFSCVSHSEVYSCFKLIKSNAVGCDNMHPKFIRILLPVLLPYITHLFNTIIMTSTFPNRWKCARVVPIPKTNSEFRPIAILCYLSKVLEKILQIQISGHIKEKKLLSENQSGFRSNHSCVSALLDVSENIRRELDEGKLNFLILLDHSKAFDTVDHGTLCNKLRHFFNFSNNSTRLLSSYLSNRLQFVSSNNFQSSLKPLTRGVPQGSILGPLLFSIYANDLPKQLLHCKVHMYADDVQLYLSSPVRYIDENIVRVNDDLDRIFRWATANGLCLNPHKSKCLIIRKKTIDSVIDVNILINGERINIVNVAKNLGIVFNNTLTWTNHVNTLVGQIYIKLRCLWPTQYFTPLGIRKLLAKSYLLPGLIYGCELFASCDSISKRKLNVLYNNIIRYVYGLRRYDHASNFSAKLYGVSFDNLLNIRVLLFLHKIIYSEAPQYLIDKIRLARSLRGKKIIIPLHRLLVSEWHFFIHAARLWNILPQTQQLNSNANSFKHFLFDFFFAQQ